MMKGKVNILYVDDEQLNLQLFAIVFKKKYNVTIAESGSEGLTKLEQDKTISVVISDMRMPGMNGIEFISKAKMKFTNLFYFILTGFEITNEISDALNQKMINKYFKKPLNSKEIEKTITETLC